LDLPFYTAAKRFTMFDLENFAPLASTWSSPTVTPSVLPFAHWTLSDFEPFFGSTRPTAFLPVPEPVSRSLTAPVPSHFFFFVLAFWVQNFSAPAVILKFLSFPFTSFFRSLPLVLRRQQLCAFFFYFFPNSHSTHQVSIGAYFSSVHK